MKHNRLFDAQGAGWVLRRKTSLRSTSILRAAILSHAQHAAQEPLVTTVLQLEQPAMTDETLRREWRAALATMRDEIAARMCLIVARERGEWSEGNPLSETIRREISDATARGVRRTADRVPRRDLDAQIALVLLERLLRGVGPARIEWIGEAVGCSYPTVSKTLDRLQPYLERTTSRSVAFSRFPYSEWHQLALRSARIRSTRRYVDRSGKPRSANDLLERLWRLGRPDIGVGGSEGARHYDSQLNLIGLPQLDVSVHCPDQLPDFGFVRQLDPGLKLEQDATVPATLVVHLVRRADPLFSQDDAGRTWAGTTECLWDLSEMRLDDQASWFIDRLTGAHTVTA